MSEYYGESRRRIVGETWFWILVTLVSLAAIAAIVFGWRWVTADPKGRLQAREQIKSGDYRIAAYDHFFDLCASVQTDEQAINASYAELGSAPADDQARIRTNITGQLISRNDAANQYNVDARKSYTRGQFRSSDLPFLIPPYQKGQVTSCEA